MKLLEVKDLAAGYNGTALRDVTFAAERGTRIGVLGPNGGGKTTLFRVLLRELRARRERRAGRPLWHGPADRALAARLSGQRAGRRADGRAAAIGMVAAARTGGAARAGGACNGGPGRRRTRDVRRAFRGQRQRRC